MSRNKNCRPHIYVGVRRDCTVLSKDNSLMISSLLLSYHVKLYYSFPSVGLYFHFNSCNRNSAFAGCTQFWNSYNKMFFTAFTSISVDTTVTAASKLRFFLIQKKYRTFEKEHVFWYVFVKVEVTECHNDSLYWNRNEK